MKSLIRTGVVLGSALFTSSGFSSLPEKNHSHHEQKNIIMNATHVDSDNKESIRNLYENILNNRKLELLDNLISPDYTGANGIKGIDGFREQTQAIFRAFPDAHWKVLELVADGDKVIIMQELTATHMGKFQNFSPTGKKISNTAFGVYEFKNGKIIHSQVHTDRLSFLQQIGFLPADISTLTPVVDEKQVVNLIDKFFIPKNSVEEFRKQLNINKAFIHSLPGFIRMEEFENKDADGNLNFVTVAFWENQSDIDNAKTAVQAEFRKNGFNPENFYQRLNIKLERGIFKSSAR